MLRKSKNPKSFVREKHGKPPGTLVHVGTRYLENPTVEIISYNKDQYQRKTVEYPLEPDQLHLNENSISWVNVSGVHDAQLISKIGETFSIHPLLQEDIMSTYQRPKIEFSQNHMLIILKMVDISEDGLPSYEQVSLLLGEGYVLSLQEKPGDVLEEIRKRIALGSGYVRTMNADYLFYTLIDAIVDRYYGVLDTISDRIETMEETIQTTFSESLSRQIHALRKDIIFLRKAIWPLRDVIGALLRDGSNLVEQRTLPYYRDVFDHIVQVMDQLETYRDLVSGLSDSYMTSVSNRMNSIMKILTLISTIFIPLTFIVGVYGMNFTHMPELDLPWAYAAVWGVMIIISIFMIIFFKRRKWF
jgi:magnesium transporter